MISSVIRKVFNEHAEVPSGFHAVIFFLCFTAGVIALRNITFENTAFFGADTVDYQSAAVNLCLGHGFPRTNGVADSSRYKFQTIPEHPFAASWKEFYQVKEGGFSFYRNPVYPFFVAGVYQIFGINPAVLKKIQLLLLILAGSLLPYLSFHLNGRTGILSGVYAYAIFLATHYFYASEILTESLLISYVMLVILLVVAFRKSQSAFSFILLGVLFGLALLLKNTLIPFVFISVSVILFHIYRHKLHWKKATLIISIPFVTILPWTIYANMQNHRYNHKQNFFFITEQGDDVLLAANNEFSTDGGWHPEWKNHPESFYNNDGLEERAGWIRALNFYAQNASLLPQMLCLKIVRGFFRVPVLLFLLSLFFHWALTLSNRLTRSKAIWIGSFLALLALTIAGIVHIQHSIPNIISGASEGMTLSAKIKNAAMQHSELFFTGILCVAVLLFYLLRKQSEIVTGSYLPLFLLAVNFILITLIFYGSGRINGVMDFAFILATCHLQITILQKGISSEVTQPRA